MAASLIFDQRTVTVLPSFHPTPSTAGPHEGKPKQNRGAAVHVGQFRLLTSAAVWGIEVSILYRYHVFQTIQCFYRISRCDVKWLYWTSTVCTQDIFLFSVASKEISSFLILILYRSLNFWFFWVVINCHVFIFLLHVHRSAMDNKVNQSN